MGSFNCCKADRDESQLINDYKKSIDEAWDIPKTFKNYIGKNTERKKFSSKIFDIEEVKDINKSLISAEAISKPAIPKPYYKNQMPDYTKQNFIDNLFPHNDNSINSFDMSLTGLTNATVSETVKLPSASGKLWLKPRDVFRKKKFFLYDTITVDDVHPGQLGNMYFLNCISRLAEKKLIERVFDKHEVSENGVYGLNIYVQGKKKLIAVDDFFPCFKNKRWVFSYAGENEVWVQIVEKVWAKMNKSYANMLLGCPADPFYALNEAPCIEYHHSKYGHNKIFDIISQAIEKDLIVFSSPERSPEAESKGLFYNQAYNILSVKEYKTIRLVYLQNRFGGFEWLGDYSDNSALWTDELKKEFNWVSCEDGKFFMKIEDFHNFFPKTFILKYFKDYKYTFNKYTQTSQSNAIAIKINLKKPTTLYLTLHLKQVRFFSKVKNYSPCMSRIMVAKYTNDNNDNTKPYKFIAACSGKSEKLTVELENLGEGEYHIFINCSWEYFEESNCSMVVSSYSNTVITLEELNKENVPDDFLSQILYSSFPSLEEEEPTSTPNNSEIVFRVDKDKNDTGYHLIFLKNLIGKDLIIEHYSVKYTNVRILSKIDYVPSLNPNYTSDIRLNLPQGREELHIFELLDDAWNCKFEVGNLVYKVDKESLDAKITKFLAENLHLCERKENLNKDLVYYEMETFDGIVLIVENNSLNTIYKIKIDFQDLDNLKRPWIANRCFIIQPNRFDYIKLFKRRVNEPINFTFSFLYKRYIF